MMLEELNMLVRLQDIDTHLMDIEAEKGDLPEQLGVLNREISRFKTTILEAEKSVTGLAVQRKQHEQTIDLARERLKKSQNTIFSVKTTREYDAISSEIEQAKHQLVDCERLIGEIDIRVEDSKRELDQAKAKLVVVEAEFKEKQADMQERMELSQDEELKLQHERDKLVVRLKKPVYAHYERIRKIRDGVGVAQVDNGACSYCYSMIPPQRQAEVRRMDDLILCEVCGCILVTTSEAIA